MRVETIKQIESIKYLEENSTLEKLVTPLGRIAILMKNTLLQMMKYTVFYISI